eukprot:3077600-Pyramimonas_sp.AAC.1
MLVSVSFKNFLTASVFGQSFTEAQKLVLSSTLKLLRPDDASFHSGALVACPPRALHSAHLNTCPFLVTRT